jgi:hypothetical protein
LAAEHSKKKGKGKLGISRLETYDHVWAVVDREVAESLGKWPEVAALARSKKVKLAPSMPCFEFWLLLHLGFTTRADLVNGVAAKKALREALGSEYSTTEETAKGAMKRLIPAWESAVRNAEQVRDHHRQAGTADPANPSTEVDQLVRGLADALPPNSGRH